MCRIILSNSLLHDCLEDFGTVVRETQPVCKNTYIITSKSFLEGLQRALVSQENLVNGHWNGSSSSSPFLACTTRSANHPLPPQRVVLSQMDCFVQCKVVGSQDSLMVFSHVIRGRPGGLFQFSGGEPLGSSWHLHRHPYVQCAQMWRDAVTGLLL